MLACPIIDASAPAGTERSLRCREVGPIMRADHAIATTCRKELGLVTGVWYGLPMTNDDMTTIRVDLMAAADRAASYGANETNSLWMSEVTHHTIEVHTTLSDPDLQRVTRLRLLTDPGCPFFDISYCYGVMKDGRHARIEGGFMPQSLRRRNLKGDLIAWAREEGVNAKRLGLLDDANWSILR